MQPRGQLSAARGPFALLSALLLLLSLRVAATPHPGSTQGPARSPGAGLPCVVLQRAARVALHFLNFRVGSPSALRVLAAVQRGHAQVDPAKGCQVNLVFSTEPYNLQDGEQRLGKCVAEVIFKNQKPRPSVNITCARLVEKNQTKQDDSLLYERLKQLKLAADADAIPDSHGYIDPTVRPIWDLAFLGSSYVMWDRTTQFSHYYLSQLSSVKQWKTDGHAVDFDYTVLLHELPTQVKQDGMRSTAPGVSTGVTIITLS